MIKKNITESGKNEKKNKYSSSKERPLWIASDRKNKIEFSSKEIKRLMKCTDVCGE